jgi:hypothetical protein
VDETESIQSTGGMTANARITDHSGWPGYWVVELLPREDGRFEERRPSSSWSATTPTTWTTSAAACT